MNENIKRVFNGWLELTPTERNEFEQEIKKYNRASSGEQTELRQAVRKWTNMQTGPLGPGCPCCGK